MGVLPGQMGVLPGQMGVLPGQMGVDESAPLLITLPHELFLKKANSCQKYQQ